MADTKVFSFPENNRGARMRDDRMMDDDRIDYRRGRNGRYM